MKPKLIKKERLKQISKNRISELVNEYLKTNKEILLKDLLIELDYFVRKLIRNYSFPKVDIEDIKQECLSIILLKSLKGYKKRKARFSTYYHWQLRSYFANKIKYYNRAKRKATVISLETPIGREGEKIITIRDVI